MKQEFYTVDDLMAMLNCQKTKAYTLIQRNNKELKEKGFDTIPGRVLKSYFDRKYGLEEYEPNDN